MVRVDPHELQKPFLDCVTDELHRRYSRRVLENVGMCICVARLLDVGDAVIHPGYGATHSRVKVRM